MPTLSQLVVLVGIAATTGEVVRDVDLLRVGVEVPVVLVDAMAQGVATVVMEGEERVVAVVAIVGEVIVAIVDCKRMLFREHILSILLLICCALAIIFGAWWYQQTIVSRAGATATEVLRGNADGAIIDADTLLKQPALDSATYTEAQNTRIFALFTRGTDADVREAAKLLREQYTETNGDAEARVLVISRILGYMQGSGPLFYNELFSVPPLSIMRAQDNPALTLKRLAEQSLSIRKTSTALFQVGNFHAAKVVAHFDSISKQDAEAIQNDLKVLRDVIRDADLLFEQEQRAIAQQAIAPMVEQLFFQQRGYLTGVLALYDPSYIPLMRYSFGKVVAISAEANKLERLALLETKVPYALLNRALFLNAIDSEKNKKDITTDLALLSATVGAHTGTHMRFFIPFLRFMATRPERVGYWFTPDRLENLAKENQDFLNLLQHYGWK